MKTMTEILKFVDIDPDGAREAAQRLHIKEDEIPFIRKSYASEKQEVLKKERAVISYISTAIVDRDRELLLPDGVILGHYRKNPVVLWGHDYKSIPIGANAWIKSDGRGLIAKTIFAKNEKADEVYRAYTEDVGNTGPLLRAFSVGFIPIEVEETKSWELDKNPRLPKRIYKKWELLEYSAIPIPSCPEALTLAVEKGLISNGLQKELGSLPFGRVIKKSRNGNEVVRMTMGEFDEYLDKRIDYIFSRIDLAEMLARKIKETNQLVIDTLKGKVY